MVCTKGLRHRWNFAPLCALDSGTGISERIVILCSLKISWSAQSPKLDVDPIRIEFTWPSHHCPAVSHCLTGKQQATSRPKLVPTNNKIQKIAKECQLIPWPTKTKEEVFITHKLLQIPLHFFLPFCRGAVSPVIKSTSPAWNTGSSTTKKSPPREFCERSQEPCEARSAWKLGWFQGDHESQVKISINYCVGMYGTDLCQAKLPLGMSKWNGPRNSREVKIHRLGIILSWFLTQNRSSWPNNYKKQ